MGFSEHCDATLKLKFKSVDKDGGVGAQVHLVWHVGTALQVVKVQSVHPLWHPLFT